MNFLSKLQKNKNFTYIRKTISTYTKRAYLVGGSVRDMLLQKVVKDFDIEIYDLSAEEFEKLALNLNAIGVGKNFFVYKYKEFDLSMPRIERKVENSHQGFKIKLINDENIASSRRDFTINALMLNIFTGEVKDFWGGIEDIKNRQIRLINEEKFKEDSLRILRGVRFASELGFIIEKKTADIMKKMDLMEISKTRIFWELEKIFLSSFPSWGLLNLYKIGIFEEIFMINPSFEEIFKVSEKIEYFYRYREKNVQKYIFLYVLLNELKMDKRRVLKHLQAPKSYFFLLDEPYFENVCEYELLKISLEKPLNKWVGICQKGLKQKAKSFKIWDKKFSSAVNSQDVLKDGFKGKEIGLEIKRRKEKEIKEFLKARDG